MPWYPRFDTTSRFKRVDDHHVLMLYDNDISRENGVCLTNAEADVLKYGYLMRDYSGDPQIRFLGWRKSKPLKEYLNTQKR
jgi:hypothetical protein